MLTEFLRSFTLPGLEKKYIVADESLTEEGAAADSKKVGEELAKKVDKETGKALSTNDYTNAEKTKLAGVASGAQVNTIEGVKVDGTEVTPDAQKKVNLNVYDKAAIDAIVQAIYAEVAKKLNIDGYSEAATAGNALGLVTDSVVEDKEPYNFRSLAHLPVGKFCYDTIVGGSIVWNQLVKNGDFASNSDWTAQGAGTTISIANGKLTLTVGTAAYSGIANTRTDKPAIEGHKHLLTATLMSDTTFTNCCDFAMHTGNAQQESGHFTLTANTRTTVSKIMSVSSSLAAGNRAIQYQLWAPHANAVEGATVEVSKVSAINLTAAVTPLIADYIYSLEQTTAGAGVAWFKKYFPELYYGYTEPHFEHVQVSAKNTVGFNLLNPANTIKGGHNVAVGSVISSGQATATLTGDNPVTVSVTSGWQAVSFVSDKLLPNTVYYINCVTDATTPSKVRLTAYLVDENYNVVRNYGPYTTTHTYHSTVTTTDKDGLRFVLYVSSESANTVTLTDLCLNLHGDRDGEYEAYKKRTYPLDSSLTLRGIPKLDSANRLYFDGDIYRQDGSGSKRFDMVDMGTLNWAYDATNTRFFVSFPDARFPNYTTLLSPMYAVSSNPVSTHNKDLQIATYGGRIYLTNFSYTDAASFKAAMSGVYLLYEKATPEPFTAEPFQSPMVIDPLGTEEFVDYAVEQGNRDVKIPCGHTSEYPEDLVDKLEVLPHATGTNGDYLITELNGKLYLKPYTQTVGLTSVSGTEAE